MTRQLPNDTARAWVEIDLGALRRNAGAIARRAGVPIMPMVKADAYGLGALPVVRALEPLGPWGFGVATVDEGEALRVAGCATRVIVFTPLMPDQWPRMRHASLTPILHRETDIQQWSAGGTDAWHLAIDTGMSRAGVRWDRVGPLADALRVHPPEGACTHFHSADLDDGTREEQEARFEQALRSLPAVPPVLHCENGPAIERRAPSRWSFARPGIFLYGVSSGARRDLHAEPVVHLRARVVDMRTIEAGETVSYHGAYRAASEEGGATTASGRRRIATLAVGYADGYRRALSNRGTGLVRGRRAHVAGIVTMDMTMLDVTDIECEVGDVATLIGRDGDQLLDVESVAGTAGMSPYELLTGLRARAPRHYLNAAR